MHALIIQIQGDHTGAEPHGKHQQKVPLAAEFQLFLLQSIGTGEGNTHAPGGADHRVKQGVGIGNPKSLTFDDHFIGLQGDVLGQQGDQTAFVGQLSADGHAEGVYNGVQRDKGKDNHQQIGTHLEYLFTFVQ